MENPTMLYRSPGPLEFEGVPCETTIVDELDVEAMLAEGWHRNWVEAGEAAKAADEGDDTESAARREAGGQGDGSDATDLVDDPPKLKAVHKGRGVWEVQDAAGNVVEGGLTGEQAKAKAGG